MTPEILLLYRLRDLAENVRPNRSQYDYLKIAAILRQLLLDRPSVADDVNRHRKVRLEFRVSLRRRTKEDSNRRAHWVSLRMDSIDPDVYPAEGNDTLTLTRDQFLSLEIMVLEGQSISVKDLIRHCANQKGAVHSQEPRSEKDKVLLRVGSALKFGSVDATTRALVPVGMITLKALRALYNRVRDELLPQGKFPAELASSMADSDTWRDLGWGEATNEEMPVTLQISALPIGPQDLGKEREIKIRGEIAYIDHHDDAKGGKGDP